MFTLETRQIIIAASSSYEAEELAYNEHVAKFFSADDMDVFKDWGLPHGFNSDNTVVWIAPRGEFNPNYLRLRTVADNFKIPVVKKEFTAHHNLLNQHFTKN